MNKKILYIALAHSTLLLLIFMAIAVHHDWWREDTKSGKTFLFIGDSITDGNWGVKSHTSKRSYKDLNHIYGHGYVYLCAAELMAEHPERQYVFHNRGISGNTIVDMASRWQQDCLDLHPDVLTIMVGINDICYYQAANDSVRAALSPQAYERNFRHLLDASLQQNPDLQIILMTPFIAQVGKYQQDWESWLALTQTYADVVKSLAQEYHATLIDTQAIFDDIFASYPDVPMSYWVWDGIHPTAAGHFLLSKAWRAAN